MLRVNNFSAKQNYQSFKNNYGAAPQKNTTQPESFKTNAGLKTATGYAAIGTALLLSMDKITEAVDKMGKECYPEAFKTTTPKTKLGIMLPIFLLTTLGCGAIVNKKINDKNAKLAADLKVKDKNKLLAENPNVQKTEKGNLYYKSKIGENIGPILGIGVIAINTVVNAVRNKKMPKITFNSILDSIAVPLGGGWLLGKITDNYANKGAQAYADKSSTK